MRDLPSKKPLTRRDTANANKCQFCNKFLPSEKALKNHLQSVHSRALRTSNTRTVTPVLPKTKAAAKPAQTGAKEEKSVEKVDKNEKADKKRPTVEESADTKDGADVKDVDSEDDVMTEITIKSEDEETAMPKDAIKTVFKCPKCIRIFNVCFLAVKHIQSTHCVNAKGETVAPSSKDLIQPITIEKCTKCDLIVEPATSHQCAYVYYECLACNLVVKGLACLYGHIEKQHAEGVESFYFPMHADFLRWKDDVEMQTKCKYLSDTHLSKTIHRCKHTRPNTTRNVLQLEVCPSVMIEQNFDGAIHVKYYWIHGHPTQPYKLNDKYEMYSITALLRNSENYKYLNIKTTDDALFLQFRSLMLALLFDAKKVDERKLSCLMKKALEMTSILTIEKSAVTYKTDKKLSDDDITKVLSAGDKRKGAEVLGNDVSKRTRSKNVSVDSQKNGKSPVILNALLAAESKEVDVLKDDASIKNVSDNDSDSIKLNKEKGKANTYARATIDSMSPSSFNDSYKDFVDKNFACRPANKNKKKNVVKTKIGQFKPSLSPKSPNLSPRSKNLSPGSKNLSPGSQNLSPRSNKVSKSPKVEMRNVKVDDVEYEVQEQENDCNILILKI